MSDEDVSSSSETSPKLLPGAPPEVKKDSGPVFDLGNLTCYFPEVLSSSQQGEATPSAAVPANKKKRKRKGKGNLDLKAVEYTQAFVAQLCTLPCEEVPGILGRIYELPEPTSRLPREKPVPKPKEPTTWEKFAASKGINKKKKSARIWDEQAQDWKRRYGYKRANDATQDWAMEDRPDLEPGQDPWQKAREEKKERVRKNKRQRDTNLARAEGERLPGTVDLTTAINTHSKKKRRKLENSHHVDVSLKMAQRATASMGKFDEVQYSEKKLKNLPLPRRQNPATRGHAAEKSSTLNVIDKILGKTKNAAGRFDARKAGNVQLNQMQQGGGKKKKKGGKKR